MLSTVKKANIKFTYYDYTLLPEDKRHELIEGDLFMTPAPTTKHQLISAKLHFFLSDYAARQKQGVVLAAPTDVVLSEEDVVQPDIFFISEERKGIIKAEHIKGAPDLIVEILSPTTADRDLITKKKLYAKYGVQEYWIADPDAKTLTLMKWTEKGFEVVQVYSANATLQSLILPDMKLQVDKIFP